MALDWQWKGLTDSLLHLSSSKEKWLSRLHMRSVHIGAQECVGAWFEVWASNSGHESFGARVNTGGLFEVWSNGADDMLARHRHLGARDRHPSCRSWVI